MSKKHTVVMFSIAPDTRRAYLYLHRQEMPVKGGKKMRVKLHPLNLIQCKKDDPEKVKQAVCHFVATYGVSKITIHEHEQFPELHLVQIHEGFPKNGDDVFNLMCYRDAIAHFHDGDHLTGGTDHVEAIRETLERLMKEAGVAA
jgi:hypothetical protein